MATQQAFVCTPDRDWVYPQAFSLASIADSDLTDPALARLIEFFESKGLAALKEEDQREQWYEDWLACQAAHHLYATLLAPQQYSTRQTRFDLLRYARFLEAFAYYSPAHGYSLQVTFLGLFSILMGSNEALKREAVAALESGGLLAFGISEKEHGSDLLAGGFHITEVGPGRYLANGKKYYIGNANAASIIAILAHKRGPDADSRAGRAPFVLLALRPGQSPAFGSARKIRTLGVRPAFVGEFEVKDHPLPETDLIAQGREAWNAVFGTVTLGKFFLGFGSIGICEHAFQEAAAHLRERVLYGKPAIDMQHIRWTMTQAYARLTAMKLYAYRALDYLYTARAEDRRYLLYAAVQKARVSTEGVKVMALLSECIGAKGFEADTYFEMALRDAQLVPGLESSTHINLGLTAQFVPGYFGGTDSNLREPPSLLANQVASGENPYLMEARTGAIKSIAFGPFLKAYQPLTAIPNVRLFVRQVRAFQLFMQSEAQAPECMADTRIALLVGQSLAAIAYAQLIAEHAVLLDLPRPITSVIFHLLVSDVSAIALTFASAPGWDTASRVLIRRMVMTTRTPVADWDAVGRRMNGEQA